MWSIIFSGVGAVAAGITVFQGLKSWWPVKLSKPEKSVLNLFNHEEFKGVLFYWPAKGEVNVPSYERIQDDGGLAGLEDKGMICFVEIHKEKHGNMGHPHTYRATNLGKRRAKKLL